MPRAYGFDQWILNKTGTGTSGQVGAGPKTYVPAPRRSLIVPDPRTSRRGALPQRILR